MKINPFKFKKHISNPFKKYILAIELGDDGVKLAILGKSKKEKRLIALEFFSGSGEELKNKLSEFLKKSNLRYSEVIASLDRYVVSSRYINLPSANYQELESMIPFQIRRLFPYSADDVTFSFNVLDTDDKGFSRIMLFVAQKMRVESFLGLLEGLNIKPGVLTISSYGVLNWYLSQTRDIEEQAAAVVDVSSTSLEFCVMYKGSLIFSRVALLLDRSKISEEIKRCLDGYNKELDIAGISNLALVGNKEELRAIVGELSDSLSVKAEILDPWQGLDIRAENKVLEKYADSGCTSILGLLTQVKSSNINLLPSQAKAEIKGKIKSKARNKTIFISLVAVLLVSLNIIKYIDYRSNALQEIEQKLSVLNPEIDKLSDMQRKLRFVKNQLGQRFLSIEILKELYKITPEGIFLNIFIYERGNQVVLKGISKQMSLVFNYVSILEKSEFLKNAQVRFATKRNIKGEEFTDFEIVCALNVN